MILITYLQEIRGLATMNDNNRKLRNLLNARARLFSNEEQIINAINDGTVYDNSLYVRGNDAENTLFRSVLKLSMTFEEFLYLMTGEFGIYDMTLEESKSSLTDILQTDVRYAVKEGYQAIIIDFVCIYCVNSEPIDTSEIHVFGNDENLGFELSSSMRVDVRMSVDNRGRNHTIRVDMHFHGICSKCINSFMKLDTNNVERPLSNDIFTSFCKRVNEIKKVLFEHAIGDKCYFDIIFGYTPTTLFPDFNDEVKIEPHDNHFRLLPVNMIQIAAVPENLTRFDAINLVKLPYSPEYIEDDAPVLPRILDDLRYEDWESQFEEWAWDM